MLTLALNYTCSETRPYLASLTTTPLLPPPNLLITTVHTSFFISFFSIRHPILRRCQKFTPLLASAVAYNLCVRSSHFML